MLCRECELFRFPYLKQDKPTTSTASAAATVSPPENMTLPLAEGSVSDVMSDGTSSTGGDKKDQIIICEILFFAVNMFDKHPPDTLKSVILEFYRDDEILGGKSTLALDLT